MISHEQILSSFPPAAVREGLQLSQSGAVRKIPPLITDTTVVMHSDVKDGYQIYSVSLTADAEEGSLQVTCSCGQRACKHVVATLYALAETEAGQNVLETPEEARRAHARRMMDMHSVAKLRKIAKRHGWKLKGTRKKELVEQVVTYLQEAVQAGTFLAGLSPKQTRLLAMAHLLYDLSTGASLAEITNLHRNILREHTNLQTTLVALIEYGILIKGTYEDGVYYFFTFPITLTQLHYDDRSTPLLKLKLHPKRRFVHGKQRPAAPPLQLAASQFGQIIDGGSPLNLAEPSWEVPDKPLEAIFFEPDDWPITAIDARKIEEMNFFFMREAIYVEIPIQLHILARDSAEIFTPLFNSSDKADWLFELFNLSNFVTPAQNSQEYTLATEPWERFQGLPSETQLQMFFLGWQAAGSVQHEFRKLLRNYPDWSLWRTVSPGLTHDYFLHDIAGAHQAIIRYLEQLAVQSAGRQHDWIKLDQFIKLINELTPQIYHLLAGIEAWGFSYRGERVPNGNNRRWQNTYGELIRAVFDGPLYWLGMVELLERGGRTVAFRLTDTGRWLLSPTKPLSAMISADSQSPSTLTWLDEPAHTLKLEAGYDLGNILSILNRYMQADPEQPTHYKLANAYLESAFAKGESPEAIIQAFVSIGAPAPANTQAYITTLHSRYGHVHIYQDLTVIEFSDDYALAELRAANIIDTDDIVHEFSPKLIVINDAATERITKALKKRKYTPRVI